MAKLSGDIAERMLCALVVMMLHEGMIDQEDLSAAADWLDERDDPEAAHQLRCILLKAIEPSQSDWEADQRRSRLTILDGGKATD